MTLQLLVDCPQWLCRVWKRFIDRKHLIGCKAPLNIIHPQVSVLASKLLLTFSFFIVVVVNLFYILYSDV